MGLAAISNPEGEAEVAGAFDQTNKFVKLAADALGISLPTEGE